MEPILSPKHEISKPLKLVKDCIELAKGLGSVKIIDAWDVQPFWSVIAAIYKPEDRLDKSSVVSKLIPLHW